MCLRLCFRDLILPLQQPLVVLSLPELCCQFGVFMAAWESCDTMTEQFEH